MIDINSEFRYTYGIEIDKESELIMRGSIRAIGGLMVAFGAVGGMDTCTDAQLLPLLLVALVGLAVMASGVKAMNQ